MLLSFSEVTFAYHKGNNILRNISFSISEGEKVALLGLNGAGKSTLMLHINGLLLPNEGEVKVKGINTRSKEVKEIRKLVGFVFQNPDDQLFMPTVWEDIAFGPRNMKLSDDEISERVEKAMIMTHTKGLERKSPFSLSGGQKKSVSIATVLSMSPELLVMDEPTAGLDYQGIINFKNIIENLPQSLLLSTHDIELAKSICDRALVLNKGELIFDGDIRNLQYPPIL